MFYTVVTKKNKEEFPMKTAVIYAQSFMNRPYVPLPNAATRRQVMRKFLDGILVGACCVGLAVVLLFLASLA